jgi:hypothetical protein
MEIIIEMGSLDTTMKSADQPSFQKCSYSMYPWPNLVGRPYAMFEDCHSMFVAKTFTV